MTWQYIVRKGQPDDCKHVLRLLKEHAEFEGYPSRVINTEEGLRTNSFGDEPLYHFFVVEAVEEGKVTAAAEIVGLSAYFFSYCRSGRKIYLDELYIQESHRGRGLGKVLMVKVAEVGVENKCIGMDWILSGANETAWPFYHRLKSIDVTAQFGSRSMTLRGENFAKLVNSQAEIGHNIQFL